MIGQTGIWLIDTDPYINTRWLQSLHYEMMAGIALSTRIPTAYGLGLFERSDGISNVIDVLPHMHHSNPAVQMYSELREQTQFMTPKKRKEVLYHYLSMAFGTYSGGYTVSIKSEENSYMEKNDASKCRFTLDAVNFPKVIEFVDSLPFREVGRIHVFVNYPGGRTPIHMDGTAECQHTNDFLWMRTSEEKQFFVFDPTAPAGNRHYVKGLSAFFNEQDYHGTDTAHKTLFSLRVDGRFTPEFKRMIGIHDLKSYT